MSVDQNIAQPGKKAGRYSMELLAPAGDREALEAALNAGADAVYLGLQDFSARKSAANFTAEDLERAARLAHALGAKVYVALNTLVKECEADNFAKSAQLAWSAGADALIIQDIFLGKMLKSCYPEMELHLSTQAGVCNAEGARLAKECGFSRVIAARETPLADIARIAEEIETECFIQGALCTCFSGQCYFSSVVGGNSGNRGFCKQPCRKKYSIDRKGFDAPAYRLSLADLCVGEDIAALARAGVASCKIEGRMRSAAYVAAAVRYYRDLLDGCHDRLADDFSALRRTFNRGNYTRGYLFGQDRGLISSDIQGHIGERIGSIGKRDPSGRYVFVRSDFSVHDRDGFKIIRKGREEIGGAIWRDYYPAQNGGFYLPYSEKYRTGDDVCVTSDTALAKRTGAYQRKVPLRLFLRLYAGEPLSVRIEGPFGTYTASSEFTAEVSRTRPTTAEELAECFRKVDALPLAVAFGDIETDGASFVVRSQLNAFRRKVWADVYEKLSRPRAPLPQKTFPQAKIPEYSQDERDAGGQIAVIDRCFGDSCYQKIKIDFAILDPVDCKDRAAISDFLQNAKYYARHKYIYLPAFCTGEDLALYKSLLPSFDGAYADGYYALELCRETGKPVFAGTGLNLFNSCDVAGALNGGARYVALSKELSLVECGQIGCPSAFVFAGGRTRVMDLGHCPFAKTCASCDRRARYTLTDESGRAFPLLRSARSACRFSVYNCLPLRVDAAGKNKLFDFSASTAEEKEQILFDKPGSFTAGASKKGIR